MSSRLRLIIFLAFVLMFLIAAPLLVLFTAGYRFDLSSGRIVHTAVLNMSSIPRNTTVIIDGEPQADRTPSIIETVLPGEHEIVLEKADYLPWKQTLFFESRETTFATDVVLFLDESPSIIQNLNVLSSHVSPAGDRLIYLTQESSWLEMWSTEGNEGSTNLLMRLSYNSANDYTLSFSVHGDYILLSRDHGPFHELTLAQTNSGDPMTLPTGLTDVDAYWWDAQNDHILYTTVSGDTYKIDIETNTSQLLEADIELATSFEQTEVFLSEHNNRSVLSFLDEGIASIITYLPLGEYTFVRTPSPLIGLYDSQHSRLILIDTSNRDQPILINEIAVRWQWSENDQQLLYSSGYDLRLYQRDQHQTHTLTRLSETIDQLAWYTRGSVILYQVDGTTYALSISDPQPEHLALISEAPGQIWIQDNGDTMLLMGTDGTIWQRELQK